MKCPYCGARTQVVNTSHSAEGLSTRRQHACLADSAHAFITEETIVKLGKRVFTRRAPPKPPAAWFPQTHQ